MNTIVMLKESNGKFTTNLNLNTGNALKNNSSNFNVESVYPRTWNHNISPSHGERKKKMELGAEERDRDI